MKVRIASLEKQLEKLLPQRVSGMPALSKSAKPARKKISAAGIAKIRAAQKARWAKIKGSKVKKATMQKPTAKKRSLSDAARAKMAAAAKARWAKVKAAKK